MWLGRHILSTLGADRARAWPPRRAGGWIQGLLAGVVLLAGPGCFEYREDTWLYGDHSGRLEGHLRVPAAAWDEYSTMQQLRPGQLEAQCDHLARQIDGVELSRFHELATSGNHRVSWTFSFATTEALQALLVASDALLLSWMPVPAEALPTVGPEAVVDRLGRLTTVRRRLPALPALAEDEYVSHALANQYARFRIHTPEPIIGNGAFHVGDDQRTATWEPALGSIVRDGFELRVSYRAPFPVARVAVIVGSLVCGVLGIWGLAFLHLQRGVRDTATDDGEPAHLILPARPTNDEEFTDEWTDT